MMRQVSSNYKKQASRRSSSVFLLRFFVGLAAVVIFALCFSVFLKQQSEFTRLNKEKIRLENERDKLSRQYDALKSLSDIADSDAYIERIARDYLDMVRPGEILIVED